MIDLEALRTIFQAEDRLSLAVVQRVEIAKDLTFVRVLCRELPEENQVIARLVFPHSSQGNGFFALPEADDLVLLAYTDPDTPRIIAYETSKDDKIPAQLAKGESVLKASSKLHVIAPRINLSKNGAPTEPLVLGTVLLAYLTGLHARLDAVLALLQAGPLAVDSLGGNCNTHPTLAVALDDLTGQRKLLDDLKGTYVDTASTNVVSQVSFTERGT